MALTPEGKISESMGRPRTKKEMDAQPKYWMGTQPLRCDFTDRLPSHAPMYDGFVDGQTTYGPWANMCLKCHASFGVGLGTGKGQKYMPVQINGITRWQKVAG